MKRANFKFTGVPVRGGKQYVEVKDRLKYLAEKFDGEYSIDTDYRYFPERKMWVVKATLTMSQGEVTSVYTGLAQEVESEKFGQVNNTSALENAETSAVGRACAMAGIGIDLGVASIDEINKAESRTARNQASAPAPAQQIVSSVKAALPASTEFGDAEPQAVVVYATQEQKEEITKLLNHPVITRQEKTKMLLSINRLDEERATTAIAKLKQTIEDRENQPSE